MSKKPKPLTHYLVFAYYNDEQQITVDHIMARDGEAAEKIVYKLRPEILYCSAEELIPFCQRSLDQAFEFEVFPGMWKDHVQGLKKVI